MVTGAMSVDIVAALPLRMVLAPRIREIDTKQHMFESTSAMYCIVS